MNTMNQIGLKHLSNRTSSIVNTLPLNRTSSIVNIYL